MEKKHGLKAVAIKRSDVFIVPLDELNEEPGFNARQNYTGIQEFAEFIRENGVLALPPLFVYNKGGKLFISDGHRRSRAARIVAGEGVEIKGIPCMNDPLNEEERTLAMVTRNSGAPLTKLEQGLVFLRMVRFGWQQNQIAKKVAKSPAYVSQCIALANAPQKVQDLLASNVVNDSTVLTMLGNVEDPNQIYDIIIESVEEAKTQAADNGNEGAADVVQRNVARAVRSRIGKETVSTRMKAFGEWVEENSIMLKDDPQYQLLCNIQAFLKGEKPLDEVVPKAPITK